MATLSDLVRKRRNKGEGVLGSLGRSLRDKIREAIDPRKFLNQTGLLTALFPKLKAFKAKVGPDIKKIEPLAPQSQLSTPMLDAIQSDTAIAAKNSMVLPAMHRDLNVMRQNISKLVKLEGGEASKKADVWFKKSAIREAAYETQIAEKKPEVKPKIEKEPPKEKPSALGTIAKFAAVGGAAIGAFAFSKPAEAAIGPTLRTFGGTGGEVPMKGTKDARKSAEMYLGRSMSDNEWGMLYNATKAESAADPTSYAMVMASILNRAKTGKSKKGTPYSQYKEPVAAVLLDTNQFQAVTGTAKDGHKPSRNYTRKATEKEMRLINYGAVDILPKVSASQKDFTAFDPKAYGPGTNLGYRNKMLREGGVTVAGTVFQTAPPTVAAIPTPKVDGNRLASESADVKRTKELTKAKDKDVVLKETIISQQAPASTGSTFASKKQQNNSKYAEDRII